MEAAIVGNPAALGKPRGKALQFLILPLRKTPGFPLICPENAPMSTLTHLRIKMYKTVARQLHGQVPCWVCGEHVTLEAATLEHIKALSEGGNSHADNLAISHEVCNGQRHAKGAVPRSAHAAGQVLRRAGGVANAGNAAQSAATTVTN